MVSDTWVIVLTLQHGLVSVYTSDSTRILAYNYERKSNIVPENGDIIGDPNSGILF